jgi:hypothetical protein
LAQRRHRGVIHVDQAVANREMVGVLIPKGQSGG